MAKSFKRNLFFALLAGAAGGALVPIMRPALSNMGRPAAKGAVRAGLLIYEQAREAVAEWAEKTSDLVAEVQAEIQEERQSAAAAAPTQSEQVVPFESRQASEPERKLHA